MPLPLMMVTNQRLNCLVSPVIIDLSPLMPEIVNEYQSSIDHDVSDLREYFASSDPLTAGMAGRYLRPSHRLIPPKRFR